MATKKATKNKPRLIDLTREQVFNMIEQAYNCGFCEGRRAESEEQRDITNIMVELEEKHGKL